MNKYEKIYVEAANKHGTASWMDTAISSLVVDLEERYGKSVDVSGPYGLRAEIMVMVGSKITVITPSFRCGGFRLFYDTGEKTERFQAGTFGDWHGFNNVQKPLPDTFEEIYSIFTEEKEMRDA